MFSDKAPSANPVFFRTYSRRTESGYRETWDQVCDRTTKGTSEIGRLTPEETELIDRYQRELKTLSSGRWLWVGNTKWIQDPLNVYGGYNCSGTDIVDFKSFGLLMDLTMQGCGTGAVLEEKYINQLPVIRNKLTVEIKQEIGVVEPRLRQEETEINYYSGDDFYGIKTNESIHSVDIFVGDSRKGWVDAYQGFLELSSDERVAEDLKVNVYLGNVRNSGERLKGFGGTANPVKLRDLWGKLAGILNKAIGRKLLPKECCLLLDEMSVLVVAGNIRRGANMRQFDSSSELLKLNLWQQDESGNWKIDPERDAYRMGNHTRVYHQKPTREECIDAVRNQYYSGEGAIQWAGEAIARSNVDLLDTPNLKKEFLRIYKPYPGDSDAISMLAYIAHRKGITLDEKEIEHRISRYSTNPCGEIVSKNFMCNLSEVHLNNIDPNNFEDQKNAFEAGALNVAALLHQKFPDDRYQYSREIDPIVAVCPTGIFDFFVKLFGADWLKWWEAGRPEKWGRELFAPNPKSKWYGNTAIAPMPQSFYFKDKEQELLSRWSRIVHEKVWEYCDRHNLRRPNRCTAVQPSGTKALLTGASSGWHPPKAQRFIRRITFGKNDPVALACIDYGYNVIPSQSDKDENGNLLNDPHSPLCTEWLVEIPTEVNWANLPGADQVDISKFSALAQFDFWMQIQRYYTRHNTSATIELREGEIEELGDRIYRAIQDDEGYISTALLARFDDKETYPRLPFEPIDKETYERLSQEVLQRRKTDDFCEAMAHYDLGEIDQAGPAGCDSDKCMFPLEKP
jgi:ribonucleotide reductase class II